MSHRAKQIVLQEYIHAVKEQHERAQRLTEQIRELIPQLVPSEHSSGDKTRRGGITKTGNGHVRRALTEAAHACSHPTRESRALLAKLDGLPYITINQ